MSKLRIAVPRGALFAETLDLLDRLGLDTQEVRENDRKLLFEEAGIITMRPSDVPTYVEAGAADLGITGKDVLMEQSERDVYELADLGYGRCVMVVASVAGEDRAAEGAALSSRAPVDLRVNTLKGDRATAGAALAHLHATPTPWSPVGLRIALSAEAKSPPILAEPAFIDGLAEVQDEGSQLAAILSGAGPRDTVIDLCAGGGGKTLSLAAAMANTGQLYAYDADARRLAETVRRAQRAGRNHH